MRWAPGARLRSAWRRLPNSWYVRGLVILLGLATLVMPIGVCLVALTEIFRERACVAAGNDWKWGRCQAVYRDCQVAGARYPLGTTYTDGCNVCRCVRQGVRCSGKYCFEHSGKQRLLSIGNGKND